MNELSWLEINLSRLQTNLAWWRALLQAGRPAAPARICAVVKANAYGLGALPVAQCLDRAGVDMLAVYSPAQAEELLDDGIDAPILILMPTRELEQTEAVRRAAADGRVHLALNDPGQLEMVQQLSEHLTCRLPVHLHLDTGMSRAGLSAAEFAALLDALPGDRSVRLAGVFSHLATAHGDGSFDAEQLSRFDQAVATQPARVGPQVLRHLAATAGACRGPQFHKDMVRLGLGLYGFGPDLMLHRPPLPLPNTLQSVFRWLARIIHVQHYPAGAAVGYGCTHRLTRDSLLGVVPVGYADGFPLSLAGKAVVRVLNGHGPHGVAPVLGSVSMDQIVVDLTDVPGAAAEALRGATVELISHDAASPCWLPTVAAAAQTSPYELLCRLSPRVPRRYVQVEARADAGALPERIRGVGRA